MLMVHSVSTSALFQVGEVTKEADGVTYHIEKQNFTYRFIKPYTETSPPTWYRLELSLSSPALEMVMAPLVGLMLNRTGALSSPIKS